VIWDILLIPYRLAIWAWNVVSDRLNGYGPLFRKPPVYSLVRLAEGLDLPLPL
jgi:hypothetical protein